MAVRVADTLTASTCSPHAGRRSRSFARNLVVKGWRRQPDGWRGRRRRRLRPGVCYHQGVGLRIEDCIFEGSKTRVCRAVDDEGRRVVVKQLRGLSAETLSRFRRELEITQHAQGEGVIEVLGALDDGASLVVEDFGARSLAERYHGSVAPLDEALSVSLRLARALASVHAKGIVHKDITPGNVLVDDHGVVKLIDFGISQVLERESLSPRPVSSFEGTPLYMSPEQTGRMNRAIDCRSDLYSLGAVMYELLSGEPPFVSSDQLELVHAHLALRPRALHEKNRAVPELVSRMVMMLLEKRAEDRYQSAGGLAHDIERYLRASRESSRVEDFALRERDHDGRLRIPEKLYGRDKEVQTLLSAFEGAAKARSRLLLVTGYSGVGKTSLVREVHRALAAERGSFVEGKFDAFQRGTPYDSLIQALRGLVRELLTRDGAEVVRLRERILSALGSGAAVLTEIIVEAEHLLGKQPPPAQLGPAEARNRFQLVITRFVRTVARADHPLVVFLDDLQWADLPSLDLINRLVTDPESKHVLWIGAYRSNEVDSNHPLETARQQLLADGAELAEIALEPLDEDDVLELVRDAVEHAKGHLRLAVACHAKTGGNAFFLRRFLESLHAENILRFDLDEGRWTWDPARVEKEAVTENVVDFIAAKLGKLPADSVRALAVAACIGNVFDLATLAVGLEASRANALEALRPALQDELVRPAEEGFWFAQQADDAADFAYRFVHDRVRHAAHALLSAEEAAPVHFRVGRFLADELSREAQHERLFEVVEHLTRGAALVTDPSLEARISELSLEAAQRATASAAFQAAHAYFGHALKRLGPRAWETRYGLTFEAHVGGARAAYLSGDYESMRARLDSALAHARGHMDRVRARQVEIASLVGAGRMVDAVGAAIDTLALLGQELPRDPSDEDVQRAVEGTLSLLHQKSPEELVTLPLSDDEEANAALSIYNSIMGAAYIGAPKLLPILAARVVQSTLKHGLCPESPYGFCVFAIVLTTINQIEVGYQLGSLSEKMLERWEASPVKARTMHVFSGMVQPFTDPLRGAIPRLRLAAQVGFDTGDLEYAAWALHLQVGIGFYSGENLDTVRERADQNLATLEHHKQQHALHCTYQYRQAIANLQGLAADATRLIGPYYDEAQHMAAMREANFRGAVFLSAAVATQVRFLFRDLASAVAIADDNVDYEDGATCTYHVVTWRFFRALAVLGLCPHVMSVDEALSSTAAQREQFEVWERASPANHRQRRQLLAAEVARIEGRAADAMDLYDRAIDAAQENRFFQDLAIANELAGRFYLARGSRPAARAYLQEAREAYGRWGAWGKVQHLADELPDLLVRTRVVEAAPRSTVATTARDSASTLTTTTGNLDVDSLVKAANAISRELDLESLPSKILEVAIENAGATAGYLLFERDAELVVEAARSADGRAFIDGPSTLDKCPSLPASIVTFVARTGERLVLGDARQEPRWGQDPAISSEHPTAILCWPIVQQGVRSGIAYLENDLTADAFTQDRIQLMELLSTQAAISIENAKLVRNLEASLAAQVALTNAHRRFVPQEFVENLGRTRIDDVQLGDSVRKEMTVLFSDMRGFTTHVEGMSSDESIEFINEYLRHMEPAIARAGGFVDSYIGDAVMALFEHADLALDAGIDMLRGLERLNESRREARKTQIQIGIGINTGELTLGTIGGLAHLKCGVIGDSVNLASRVESLTARYGVSLLTTSESLQRLPDASAYDTRIVDRVQVLGRIEPVFLYEVFDADPPGLRERKLAVAERYSSALEAYYERDFVEAATLLRNCRSHTGPERVIDTFLERCEHWLKVPPRHDWDGVEKLAEKA